jgi:CheY-like chemotaxis protein
MKRVLIVEDDESVRDYLRTVLEQAGYAVTAVTDGERALAYLEHSAVDVILLDLMMPVRDGWETAAALQADPVLCMTPIIVVSALGELAPPGVAATLTKPGGLDDLLPVIQRVLQGGTDRRRTERYPACLDVLTSLKTSEVRMRTRDVSQGAMSFDAPMAPRVGERLSLTVDLAVHGAATVDVEVRNVAAGERGWRVGAQFVEFHENADGFAAVLASLAALRF